MLDTVVACVAATVLAKNAVELALVEAEVVEHRVELAQRRVDLGEQRAQVLEHPLGGREALRATRRSAGRGSRKNALRSGASAAEVGQRRRQLARGRAQLRDERVGVARELRSAASTVCARLALERRQRDERLLQLAVALRGRLRTRVLEFSIRSRSWPSRSVSASNTTPVSEISRRTAGSWRLRMSTSSDASSANGPRLPSASLMSRPWPRDRLGLRLHPLLERRARLGSNVRRISSSSTVSDTLPSGSRPPSGSFARALGAGRELDVGLAQQRLLAQDRLRVRRAAARTWRRARSSRASGPVFASGSIALTLPTGTPEIRTSASVASCDASANDALTR